MVEPWKQRQKKRTNEMLVIAYLIVATCADISITLYALDIGFVEANPIMAFLMNVSIPFAIAIKYAIVVIPAVITLLYLNKKGRATFIKGLLVSAAITTGIVAWNMIALVIWS